MKKWKTEIERERKENRKEKITASEQGPDVELKFPVLVFSMLNTSWSTHHYPTALALSLALSLSLLALSQSLMPAEREKGMGHGEGEVGGAAPCRC